MKGFCILSLLILSLSLCSGDLLVRKYFDSDTVVAEQEMTVTIILYNVDDEESAFNVNVEDEGWGSNWKKTGTSSKKFSEVPPKSSVNFTYQVTPLDQEYSTFIQPARVTYEKNDSEFEVLSTASSERIYRSTYYSRIYYSTPSDWFIFGSLAVGSTLPSLSMWFYYLANYENGIRKKNN